MSDDELTADLARFERGEIPSPFGELVLTLPRGPVSQQAKRARKDALTHDVSECLRKYQFYLTGDVQLELEWLVHERLRYESDEAADVDNILKPTLDAVSGSSGILINDCQVQSVTSTWIDWTREEQQLSIRIRHSADEFMARSSLTFVDLGQSLYMPVSTSLPPPARGALVTLLSETVGLRDKATALGMDYYPARIMMPSQRLYHRSRLAGFRLGTLDAYRAGYPAVGQPTAEATSEPGP